MTDKPTWFWRANQKDKRNLTVVCNVCVLITAETLKNYEKNGSLQGVDVTENLIRTLIY